MTMVNWASVPDHRIPVRVVPSLRTRDTTPPRAKFVKGPLPIGWICAAVRCGDNQALPILLALKAKSDATRETWVKPPATILQALGITRMARSRAIAALEHAGLIEIQRRRGRPPLVSLVPWKDG
jgi:hypothetical protein